MVLYHAMTNYHLLCCILHKIIYNNDKKCVLYLSHINMDITKLLKNLKKSKIFEDVKVYYEYNFSLLNESETIDKFSDKLTDFMKEHNDINFGRIDEYYVCADQYSLAMYLILNKIKYNYFEEACGILSKSDVVCENVKKISKVQYNFAKELKLFGESEFVINRYGNLSKQEDGYYNEKDVDFNIPKLLSKLSKKDIKRVIGVFQNNIDSKLSNENIDLLLTQHFINLKFLDYEEQKNLYTLLVDYFAKSDKLVIKPHPTDIHGLYSQWFPNSIVLDRSLPSELISYCFEKKFELGITASSTAMLGMENIKKTVCFDNEIIDMYKNINKYYFSLLVLKNILTSNDSSVFLMGCYSKMLENLTQLYESKFPKMVMLEKIEYPKKESNKNRNIFIVDELSKLSDNPRKEYLNFQKKLSKDDIIIFINSDEKKYFYHEQNMKNMKNVIPILILKKEINNNAAQNLLNSEWIYIYTKNKESREIINNMEEKIKLENTGIELEVNQKDKIEIKTLEGILHATEERLLEEIKVNKKLKQEQDELNKKIQKMKNSKSWKVTKPLRKISKKIKKVS